MLQLHQLEPNTPFTFAGGLGKFYRNLVLKYVSPSSATIVGERLEGGSWKPLGASYTISSGCEVEIDTSDRTQKAPEESVAGHTNTSEQKKRGRKPILTEPIQFPVGINFTIKEIAEKTGLKTQNVYQDLKKNHEFKHRLVKQISNGRGRATNVYIID